MIDMLIFEAHPDDTEIAMGGTLSLLVSYRGLRAKIVTLTTGEKSPITNRPGENITIRKQEGEKAATILGVKREFCALEDANIFRNLEEARSIIMNEIERERPRWVFTHWYDDSHTDHKCVAEIIREMGLDNVIYWNEYSTLIFKSNLYVDVTEQLPIKRKLINCFKSQHYAVRYRVIQKLNRELGKKVGKGYAEVFYVPNRKTLDQILAEIGEFCIITGK